jgi:hypothetical protein
MDEFVAIYVGKLDKDLESTFREKNNVSIVEHLYIVSLKWRSPSLFEIRKQFRNILIRSKVDPGFYEE